jgi:hypothetical protein
LGIYVFSSVTVTLLSGMSKQRSSSAGYVASRCPFPASANYRACPPFGTGQKADKPPFCLNFQPQKPSVVNWGQHKAHERTLQKYEMNPRRRLLIKASIRSFFDVPLCF